GTGRAAEAEDGPDPGERLRVDPLAVLAETAGYDDPERWWEDMVEHRAAGPAAPVDVLAPFTVLGEAMAELRARHGDGGHPHDAIREAHMRLRLRAARREFGDRIAVVCGAWHVPALSRRSTVTADRALLKGLPKVKPELSWVPWTHRRLSRYSGYGAGITSPGWYSHLFHAPDRPVERWLTKVAGLLRTEDYPVSSAHVIEAVRLAETLAAMRGRPLAGLGETVDAVRAVMCEGSDVPLVLVQDRLVVGEVLGEVPESAPAVPLQRDLSRVQRSLRLKPTAAERELDLDLRKETDAARSRLLHRLRLLDIDWGVPARPARGSTGTFRESWRLRWEPELSVRVAEAGVWGTTVHSAATAKAESLAREAASLGEVTELAERCLLAGLGEALPEVMRVLADRAALDTDVRQLAGALPALVRSVRYGDVRGTETEALTGVARGLAQRLIVGLPPACVGLDAEGAAELRGHLEQVHQAIGLLSPRPTDPRAGASGAEPCGVGSAGAGAGAGAGADEPAGSDGSAGADEPAGSDGPAGAGAPTDSASPAGSEPSGVGSDGAGAGAGAGADGGVELYARWSAALRTLADRDGVSGLIRGRAARLLLDDRQLDEEAAARLMRLALSPATEPAQAAAWIEGFIGGGVGGGMLLVHDERLLALVDEWLVGVRAEAFTDVLPLLRRTFAGFETGVRRTLGELVRRGPVGSGRGSSTGPDPLASPPIPGFGPDLDPRRAAAALPTVRLLLGMAGTPTHPGAGSGPARD
ncbi:DUF5682 family protein, partial [Streptomyces palmae]